MATGLRWFSPSVYARYNGHKFFRGEALLGGIRGNIDLQEDIDYAVIGRTPVLDGIEKMHGIDRLDKGNVRQYQLKFVGLKVANEMPLHVGWHQRNLGRKFLWTAFSKNTLPGLISLAKSFHRMELGYSNKRHPLRK